MQSNFSVTLPDELCTAFERRFARDDRDAAMAAILKRAIFVRRFFESDEAMLAAFDAGMIQFSPLRLR